MNLPLLRRPFFFPDGLPLILWCFSFSLCVYMGRSHAGGPIVLVAMCLWWQCLQDPKLGLNSIYSCVWPWIADLPEPTSPVKGWQILLLKYSTELAKKNWKYYPISSSASMWGDIVSSLWNAGLFTVLTMENGNIWKYAILVTVNKVLSICISLEKLPMWGFETAFRNEIITSRKSGTQWEYKT